MSAELHRRRAAGRAVRCAVLTVSDTRTAADDASGALAAERLGAAGHTVVQRRIVPDDERQIQDAVRELAGDAACVVVTGGTGLGPRDVTPEAVEALMWKPLPGFGELFRALSFAEIGAAAMLSRATAGLVGDRAAPALAFCCPGSTKAVALALDRLIVPELAHAVWLARPSPFAPE